MEGGSAEIKALLEKYKDEGALAKLTGMGEAVVPVLRRAYARLDAHGFLDARWYNRVFIATAGDPAAEAISLLPKAAYQLRPELAWVLRRCVAPEHADALRLALSKLGMPLRIPRDGAYAWHAKLATAAVLCEGLGIVGGLDDMPLIRRLLHLGAGLVAQMRAGDAFVRGMFGIDVVPAAATAAAALLAISERCGLDNEPERVGWRITCVDLAEASGFDYSTSFRNPPMPFLFVRSPVEAGRVLMQLAEEVEDLDRFLPLLSCWLEEGQELGAPASVELPEEWLKDLEERAWPGGQGWEAVLRTLAILHPSSAAVGALSRLSLPRLFEDDVFDAIAIAEKIMPLKAVAGIVVEGHFLRRSLGSDEDERDDERKALNERLRESGLSPIVGWSWAAPKGQKASESDLEGLHGAFCDVAIRFQKAAKATAPHEVVEALGSPADVASRAFLRHAYYRNLLVAAKRAKGIVRATLLAYLQSMPPESELQLAKAVHAMASDLLGTEAGPVYEWLMAMPVVRQNEGLAEKVARSFSYCSVADVRERLFAFAQEMDWGSRGVGFDVAVAEAMGRLGVPEAVPTLRKLIGRSGLGSEFEIALLQIAAQQPGSVDDETYARAFMEVAADEYAEHRSVLLGDQARALVVRLLRIEKLSSDRFRQVCEFLAKAAGDGSAPPQALPILLSRAPVATGTAIAETALSILSRAIEEAQKSPGEEWEDRNWGGYNASPAEETAQAISEAVQALAKSKYSLEDWRVLLNGLVQLRDVDLTRVEMAEYTGFGYRYPRRNVWAWLRKGLKRLEDPEVDQMLEMSSPWASMQMVFEVLRRKSPVAEPSAHETGPDANHDVASAPSIEVRETSLSLAPGVDLNMVCVPAGEFPMGSADVNGDPDEIPQHTLSLAEFHIGKYPVTLTQFKAFMDATGYRCKAQRLYKRLKSPEQPVRYVSWDDAVAFCRWATEVTGRNVTLPAEAQWEKAARGPDGRAYPWGNQQPDETLVNYNYRVDHPTPVGQYSLQGDSPYGCADMAGNVWEWTSSLHKPYPYDPDDGREDPDDRDFRVARGGSFVTGASDLRVTFRLVAGPEFPSDNIGFRVCVGSA